ASRRRRNPLHRVKIFVWSAQDGVVVATRFQVGPFGDVAAGLDATAARIIVADGRGRRQSRASPQNRIEGPSARQSVANLSDICSKLLAVPHRKLIGSRSDEVVLDVNRREALLSSAIVPVLRRTLRPLLALAAGISYVSQILSPRVGQVVLQAVTVFLLELHLERVVPGMAVEGLHAVSLKVRIPSSSKTGFSGGRCVPPIITNRRIEGLNGNELVGIGAGRQVLAVAPDVGGRADHRFLVAEGSPGQADARRE